MFKSGKEKFQINEQYFAASCTSHTVFADLLMIHKNLADSIRFKIVSFIFPTLIPQIKKLMAWLINDVLEKIHKFPATLEKIISS